MYFFYESCSVLSVMLLLLSQRTLCDNKKFPNDFLFGVSSSAYQIEGGYEYRGETVFDHYQRLNSSLVLDKSDAKIACDSYHRYKEDIALLENLGVNFYRFSISWPRILPTGYSNQINSDGIRYYNNLIDGLLEKNIQPMVTMYHYDLPKALQDIGGWANPLMADLFEDYARILFENFGDRVKYWITFNSNFWGYGDAEFPPMLNQSGIGEYFALKTILMAHSKVYHLRPKNGAQVGITIDGSWYQPASDSLEDIKATERAREFLISLIANPIFGDGDYPKIVIERVKSKSQKQGFLRSRLPELSLAEQKYFKGSADFLGFNIYTSSLVKDLPESVQNEYSYNNDIGALIYKDPEWPGAKSSWLKIVPSGLRNVLKWIKDKYNNPPVFITENGFSDDGHIHDVERINYHQLYLKALLEAIHEDGAQVKGYAAWSLLDNFEWMAGYTERFGLHHVDFNDPNRKRTPKSSAKWYKNLIERRQLDETVASNTFKTEL